MEKYTIYRKCPFCNGGEFSIEPWGENLYHLSCNNKDTCTSMWVELNRRGRFQQVSVHAPQSRPHIKSSSEFDKLQIPFWKLMGQKAKPSDIAYEKYLNRRGMTYGDAVLERSLYGTEKSGFEAFNKTR